ncbi:FixH family protein [Nocardia stercoris]|uniref:FixH family protein n=1 Tax=Nocardia stercoris TaxID=2483361 RepID=UPI001319E504|nr:FixH family protein [Nocardia stercoris]
MSAETTVSPVDSAPAQRRSRPPAGRVTAVVAAVAALSALAGWLLWPDSGRSVELHGGTARFVLTVTVADARQGASDIDLRVDDRAGHPVQGLTIRLDASDPRMGYADAPVPAVDSGPGRYHAAAVQFMATGQWNLTFTLDGPDGTDRITVPLWISG